ncbi:hypothetical protein B0H14DRAFT_2639302 [Mycena olivaceomarginata]|nr:hypothetical protein B0H14DRAFT_2639302 [Mycena olivaceomarginata]
MSEGPLPPTNVQTPKNSVLHQSPEENDNLQRAAKLRLKRDQWKAASARYYERHPEVREKKRFEDERSTKQARRRWDPPRAARGRCATVEQRFSDDDLTVDHVELETRGSAAEELRAARRARLEDFADRWARQRKAEVLGSHATVSTSEPPRPTTDAHMASETAAARCLLLLSGPSADGSAPVAIAAARHLAIPGTWEALAPDYASSLINAFSDDDNLS